MFDTSQITNLLVLLLSSIRITDETAFTESEIEGFQDYHYYYSYFIGQHDKVMMIQNYALIIMMKLWWFRTMLWLLTSLLHLQYVLDCLQGPTDCF